jgi:hypothetical protein
MFGGDVWDDGDMEGTVGLTSSLATDLAMDGYAIETLLIKRGSCVLGSFESPFLTLGA